MSSISGRSNRNERGSSYDRRARKQWMVRPAAGFGGDGTKVPCWECGKMLALHEIIADRIIPGELGGTYRRSNIRGPHCTACSCRQGQRRTLQLVKLNDVYGPDDTCLICGAHYLAEHADGCETGALQSAW